MCFAVYIGTNEKQKTDDEWIKGQTEIYFQELSVDEEVVKQKFTKPFIYYVGADTGCSCGFALDVENFDDPEQDNKKSPQKLINFIATQTKKEDIEFYCCWEGDWNEPVETSIKLNIIDISLDKNYFGLEEKQFILFKKQSSQ